MPRKLPPGPPTIPFIGPLGPFLKDPLFFMMNNHRLYGNVVRIDLLGLRGAALHGAEANRFVLVEGADNFVVEPLIERVRARWIVGGGLLFIDDPAHRDQRRLIMPAFSRKRIAGYQTAMRDTTAQMLDRWQPGEVLDMSREMHRLALTIVGRTLFSMDLAGSAHELGEAVAETTYAFSSPFSIAFAQLPFDVPPVGRGAKLRRGLHKIDSVLERVIAEHEESKRDTGDVVSMLVAARDEEGGRLTAPQIRDHLLTLFVAGHETSANALTWAFYLLAQHPDVTNKLLHELDTQLHGEPPTAADLERLPYLEQVIKETLRIYPPVPSANRIAANDFEWKGYLIKKGEIVTYAPFITHHTEDCFPDPETFRPERWDPAHGDKITPYAYIPFSSGPRSCVGAPFANIEMKTVVAMTLQRYRLDLVPGTRIQATVRTTVQPEGSVPMRPQPQDGKTHFSPAPVYGNLVGAIPGPNWL